MPVALATSIRRRIVEAHLGGESLKAISHREHLSYSCVRTSWRRYRQGGLEGLGPDYQNCGHRGPGRDDLIYRAARYLKYRHRQWGAPLIRLKLKQRYPDRFLPSIRTLQRWFKKADLAPIRKRLPQPDRSWAQVCHDVWQIDAKEQLTLEEGTAACYLTLTDEHSGALLETPVFPPQPDQSGGSVGRS